jgi:hypothetical protein
MQRCGHLQLQKRARSRCSHGSKVQRPLAKIERTLSDVEIALFASCAICSAVARAERVQLDHDVMTGNKHNASVRTRSQRNSVRSIYAPIHVPVPSIYAERQNGIVETTCALDSYQHSCAGEVGPGAVEFRRRAASNLCGAAAVENLPSRRRISSAPPLPYFFSVFDFDVFLVKNWLTTT